jgi:hypothetical protein
MIDSNFLTPGSPGVTALYMASETVAVPPKIAEGSGGEAGKVWGMHGREVESILNHALLDMPQASRNHEVKNAAQGLRRGRPARRAPTNRSAGFNPLLIHQVADRLGHARGARRPFLLFIGGDQARLRRQPGDIVRLVRTITIKRSTRAVARTSSASLSMTIKVVSITWSPHRCVAERIPAWYDQIGGHT